MAEYWNHNSAYHPWLIPIAAQHCGNVLDVGCGEGLLAQRMAPVSGFVTGIDPDPAAVRRARDRLAGLPNVAVEEVGFDDYDAGSARFDLIVFVASLHHLDLRASLTKAQRLLRPGGEIAVVGLSANKTAGDWLWSAVCLPAVRIGSWLHAEFRDIGVPVAEPKENLAEIRHIADDVLPGAHIRRALYYRYLLRWQKPASQP
jgi:SAM-dependent methyltransferase